MDFKEKIISSAKIIAKGKTVMAVYSYAMIVLSFYAVIAKSPLDGSISAMYGIAVGAYAYSKKDKTP
jgi:hypothetical protein